MRPQTRYTNPLLARVASAGLSRLAAGVLATALAVTGCESGDPAAEVGTSSDDLTSNTALARDMTFAGVVYVDVGTSDAAILQAVKKQTQSAFGAFRENNIAVNSRELGEVDAKAFIKTPMDAIAPATGAVAKKVIRVTYTYKDTAVVPKSMSTRSSISLGLLHGNYSAQVTKVLADCTSNDSHAQEFSSSVWYVFNPSLSSCKKAMAAEQKLIDGDRAKLTSPATQVVLTEANRLYVPMTAKLVGNKTNKGTSYPEYDRLWSGGVQKGRLTIASVNGMLADWHAGGSNELIDDEGWREWLMQLREVFKARAGWKLVSAEGLTAPLSFSVGGKSYTATSMLDVISWELDGKGWPAGLPSADQRALRVAVGKQFYQRWLRFELPLKVKIGTAAVAPVILTYDNYFGAGSSSQPHKRGIKQADVFLYNGHSYIGYGPLDPSNFSSSDMPSSYQIFFIDSCVSYNYYEKDYFKLKTGASANLDIITNGLETWTTGSGAALGRFIAGLTNGSQLSWSALLKTAEVPYAYSWGGDALRVVDGELDNLYKPTTKKITVTN